MLKRLAIAAGIFVSIFNAAAGDLPEIKVNTCEKGPVIDGKLDEPCWKQAESIKEFYLYRDKQGRKTKDTTVKLLADRKWLYIGFECKNPEMDLVECKFPLNDEFPDKDESVEMFLVPANAPKVYFHYILSFANVRAEQKILHLTDKRKNWNNPWYSATTKNKDGWTAEVAIPMFQLYQEGKDLSKLRGNFTRNKIEIMRDNQGAKWDEKRQRSSWGKVARGYHELDKFGNLTGLGKLRVQVPFLPSLINVETGKYQFSNGRREYPVSVNIRNITKYPGKLVIEINDVLKSGKTETVKKLVGLKGREKKTFKAMVPVATIGKRTIEVKIMTPEGSLLARKTIDNPPGLKPMTVTQNLNYYTSEKNVKVRFRFDLPESVLKKITLQIRNVQGKVLTTRKSPAPETVLEIPLDKFKLGKTALKAAGLIKGKVFSEMSLTILKLKPKPGHEVKIDHFNRILRDNGKPFFGLCVYTSHRVHSNHKLIFKTLADNGVNVIFPSWRPNPKVTADAGAFMETAMKYNLKVGIWQSVHPEVIPNKPFKERVEIQRKWFEKLKPELLAQENIVRKYPNLLMYKNVDEPNLLNYDGKIKVAEWFYKMLKKVDPYHPVYGLYARNIPNEPNATSWFDLLSFDYYAFPGWKSWLSDVGNMMAMYTTILNRRCAPENKPTWMTPMFTSLDPVRCPRSLSGPQQLCQSYIAIICGAKGLIYYNWTFQFGMGTFNAVGTLAKHLKVLSPAILTGQVGQQVRYQPVEFDPERRSFPEVYAAIFRNPGKNEYFLMTANARNYKVETKFSIPGCKFVDVSEKFPGKEKPETKTANSFKTSYTPWGVKTFVIRPEKLLPEPLKLIVTSKGFPKTAKPEPDLDAIVKATRKRKNLMPNPLLKMQTVPGYPDFVRPFDCMLPDSDSPGKYWFVDNKTKWNGIPGIKMTHEMMPGGGGSRKAGGTMASFFPPKISKPTTFIMSLYLKAAKAGQKAGVVILQNRYRKRFVLTTEWKRYQFKFILKPSELAHNRGGKTFLVYPLAGATVWVSGIQVEKGTKATEFSAK